MHHKTRMIALVTLSVFALVLVMPSARTFNNWRVAHKVPRIETFALRAPTLQEARKGADVGYTARVVVPDDGGPFWIHSLEFNNASGQIWRSGTTAWNRIIVASKERVWDNPDFIPPGNADNRNGVTVEFTGGLKWERIAGKNTDIQAKISLWPDDGARAPQVKASRVFILNKPS